MIHKKEPQFALQFNDHAIILLSRNDENDWQDIDCVSINNPNFTEEFHQLYDKMKSLNATAGSVIIYLPPSAIGNITINAYSIPEAINQIEKHTKAPINTLSFDLSSLDHNGKSSVAFTEQKKIFETNAFIEKFGFHAAFYSTRAPLPRFKEYPVFFKNTSQIEKPIIYNKLFYFVASIVLALGILWWVNIGINTSYFKTENHTQKTDSVVDTLASKVTIKPYQAMPSPIQLSKNYTTVIEKQTSLPHYSLKTASHFSKLSAQQLGNMTQVFFNTAYIPNVLPLRLGNLPFEPSPFKTDIKPIPIKTARLKNNINSKQPIINIKPPTIETVVSRPKHRDINVINTFLERKKRAAIKTAILADQLSMRPPRKSKSFHNNSAQITKRKKTNASNSLSSQTVDTIGEVKHISTRFNKNALSLIGISGTKSSRKALFRSANGYYKSVKLGQKINNWKVVALSKNTVKIQNGSKSKVLKMP